MKLGVLSGVWQRNLAALWVAQSLAMVAFSFAFPFIPLYVQTLGVEGPAAAARWAGMINAASAISMALAQPFWGNLADRWGRKPMVVRSMIGNGLLTILMGFASCPEHLLVLRLVQELVTGTIVASNALVSTSTPRERLGFALGIMQVAVFFGTSVGPLLGGVVADVFGYRASFFIAGLLMLSGGLLVVFLVREKFVRPPAGAPRRSVWAESRSLLAMAVFPVVIGVNFMIQLGGTIVSPVLTLFIAELSRAENAATVSGTVFAATGAVSAVSAVVIGRIGDRVSRTVVLPICLLGSAVVYFPQAFVHEVWQLAALRVALGLFVGGLGPTANALIARIIPAERRGAAFGLSATASALANAVGPLSGAAIAAGQRGAPPSLRP